MIKLNKIVLIGLCLTVISLFWGCSKQGKSTGNNTGNTDQLQMPKILSVNPSTAFPGDTIMITGSGFGKDLSVISVMFGDKKASVTFLSETQVKVVVPPGSGKSWAYLVISVSGKASDSYVFIYTEVLVVPEIDSLSSLGIGHGDDSVFIFGSGFGKKMEELSVSFDVIKAYIISVTDSCIQVKVPAYSGKNKVAVGIEVNGRQSNRVAFYYKGISYTNPVATTSLPDPTVIKGGDGWFYLYATEDTPGMPIMRSKDLTGWEWTGLTVFNQSNRPGWLGGGGLWAPDISFVNNQYVLYYSLSTWGEERLNGIGVATSPKPQGPFTDHGKLFTSEEIGVRNSIDQDLFVDDDGKTYLFWGSLRGLYMIEMNTDGLSVKSGALKQAVAGNGMEGTYLYKRGPYYYVFASVGSCCNGLNSTYQLVVGRSSSIAGPYINKSGSTMLNGGYTVVVSSNNNFIGNGHCSQIIKDDAGDDWILFHGHDARVTGQTDWRKLLLERLYWDDNGWPYIGNNGTPSVTAPGPFFKAD